MALYHTHSKSKITPYLHRIQKQERLPLRNKLTFAINSLCIKLNEITKYYNGKNEKEVKRNIVEEFDNLENIIFEDSSLYQCFLDDYLSKNVKETGEFREQIKATCKKIKDLDFKGLTPEQVTKKIAKLFETELKGDALSYAEEINDDFLNQKKEIVSARVEQWKRFRLLVDDDSTLAKLTLKQFENLVQNTPELMNAAPEEIKGLDTIQFEKMARADNISIKSSCSYEHCCQNEGQVDTEELKEIADYASKTGKGMHLDKVVESTTHSELPYTINYSADQLKDSFNAYLDAVNSSCEEVSSCTFMQNLLYDPKASHEDLSKFTGEMETVAHTEATIEVPYSLETTQSNYSFDYENATTVSSESSSFELKPCIWQTLGDDWYIQLLEMGKEKMPNTKFYYSETNLDNPDKAKQTFEFLNTIRDYEIKKEEETGEDCTLIDGISIPYSMKADEATIEGLDKSIEVISKVIETAKNGFNETDEPVRISDVKVEKVTKDEKGEEISDEVATSRQKQVYEAISDVVTTYNSSIANVELAGFSDSVTIDESSLSFDYEIESSPYLYDASGQEKEELGASTIIQSFEGLSEEDKKKLQEAKQNATNNAEFVS